MSNVTTPVDAHQDILQLALSSRGKKKLQPDEIDNKLVKPHQGINSVHEHVAVSSPGVLEGVLQRSKGSRREMDEATVEVEVAPVVTTPEQRAPLDGAEVEDLEEEDDEPPPMRGILPTYEETSHDCGNDVPEDAPRWEPNMNLHLTDFDPIDVRYLAEGAMCQCFVVCKAPDSLRLAKEACPVSRDQPVVIKTPIDGGHDVAENDLLVEATILKEICHPNIISLLGKGESSAGVSFIVLEYLAGGTLRSLLDKKKGGLGVETSLNYGRQLASALSYMHDDAVPGTILMHRDLKPDNIAFTSSGVVKIFDFGLAKIIRRTRRARSVKYHMTGMTGSPRYMSPEVTCTQPYNEKSDVWSYTIILWEMLSGQLPFVGLRMAQYVDNVCKGTDRPILKPTWPEDLRRILKSGWEQEPDRRPSFREIHGVVTGLYRECCQEPGKDTASS